MLGLLGNEGAHYQIGREAAFLAAGAYFGARWWQNYEYEDPEERVTDASDPAGAHRVQLRLEVLRLRMQYLAFGGQATREEEEAVLRDLDHAVQELKKLEPVEKPAPQPSGKGPASAKGKAGKEPKTIDERRGQSRTPGILPVVVRLERQGGETYRDLALTRDLTWHGAWLVGLQIVAPFRAETKERVIIDLGLPDGTRAMGLEGQVRWCTASQIEPGRFLMGLRITEIPESVRPHLKPGT